MSGRHLYGRCQDRTVHRTRLAESKIYLGIVVFMIACIVLAQESTAEFVGLKRESCFVGTAQVEMVIFILDRRSVSLAFRALLLCSFINDVFPHFHVGGQNVFGFDVGIDVGFA